MLLPLATPWSAVCGQDHFVYPSLVDANSPSRNFDVIGRRSLSLFRSSEFRWMPGTLQRDLVRMKLRLSFE